MEQTFFLTAITPSQNEDLTITRLRLNLFSGYGLVSALALPSLAPVGYSNSFASPVEEAISEMASVSFKTAGVEVIKNCPYPAYYLKIEPADYWETLRQAYLESAPGDERTGPPCPYMPAPCPGFFLAFRNEPAPGGDFREESGSPGEPGLPELTGLFGSTPLSWKKSFLSVFAVTCREEKLWWTDFTWELIESRPLPF